MATATDTLTHVPSQPSRRAVLGTLAAVPVAAVPAGALAQAEDPHVAWIVEWRTLHAFIETSGAETADDIESRPEGRRMFELEDLIGRTPAATVAGIAAQAEILFELEATWEQEEDELLATATVRNLHAALMQLTGRA